MFGGTKQAEDLDSDSDWDSLPGDAEPPSDLEPTPRLTQPKPPNDDSFHIQTPNIKNTSTPIKSNPRNTLKPATATNPNPGKMYGKSASVTTFVDRDYNNESIEDKRKKNSIPLDSDSNRMSGHIGGRKEKPLELNDLDFNPTKSGQTNMGFHSAEGNPPYDFKDAIPKHEVRHGQRLQQKRNKMKSEYIRNQTPDYAESSRPVSDHSWDDSTEEDGPEVMTNHRQPNKIPYASKPLADNPDYAADVYIPDDEACCMPYEKKKGNGYTYRFNHGKYQYFNVIPEWREPYMKTMGERTERWLTYFWQEFFGAIGLIVDFGLIFLLELIKFTFRKVLVRLVVGFVIVFGDHLLKPILAALFNSLLQPTLSFTWNFLIGLKNAIQPLLDITRELLAQATSLLKGFRLFEFNWKPVINTSVNSRALLKQRIQEI